MRATIKKNLVSLRNAKYDVTLNLSEEQLNMIASYATTIISTDLRHDGNSEEFISYEEEFIRQLSDIKARIVKRHGMKDEKPIYEKVDMVILAGSPMVIDVVRKIKTKDQTNGKDVNRTEVMRFIFADGSRFNKQVKEEIEFMKFARA